MSVYWDTETGTLRRAGLTLRRRTEGRSSLWQLKLPAGSARNEVEVAGRTAVPPELAALLHAHIALGGPLQEIARLRTRRLVALVENARGRVEIAHDTVDILDGRRKTATFSELELELKDGQPGALKRLAKKIDAEPAPTATKLDRAFGPLDSDTAPLLTRLLRAQLDAILAHDPGVRLGGQAEDVHQMRVGLRRTLACVRGGAEWLDATWVEEIRPEI